MGFFNLSYFYSGTSSNTKIEIGPGSGSGIGTQATTRQEQGKATKPKTKMTDISENKSTLKQFIASIATIKGDLSNITAPPFLLAPQSTTQFPKYWVEQPSIFIAPTRATLPQARALLVLKWFLSALKQQQYAGRNPSDGVKKPLNAILGELFLVDMQDDDVPGVTKLVSEQVSHHPPITACCLWNDECGIRAEGYTRQRISFSGSVHIEQIGHAILHIDKYDEDYLIPLPNVTVKGILTGSPYPELDGTYTITSSNGYVSEIDFSGKGFFSGKKNSVHARVYHVDSPKEDIYTVEGVWSESFVFKDASGTELETYDVNAATPAAEALPARDQQDPWESQRIWGDTADALKQGNIQGVADAKGKVEQAQRAMRAAEEKQGTKFSPVFFRSTAETEYPQFAKLAGGSGAALSADKTGGVWRFDRGVFEGAKRPFRGEVTPFGEGVA